MNLDPYKEYTSQLGRTYRVSKVSKVIGTEKWIGNCNKYYWDVVIIFTDNKGGKSTLTYDYYDKLVGKL